MSKKSATTSALKRAIEIQDQAAQYRFDWTDILPVFNKLDEEIDELKQAIAEKDKAHIKAEFGDILFVLANLARHLDIDPDSAIEQTNTKFEQRFNYVLKQLDIKQTQHSHSLEAMESQWQQSKQYFP